MKRKTNIPLTSAVLGRLSKIAAEADEAALVAEHIMQPDRTVILHQSHLPNRRERRIAAKKAHLRKQYKKVRPSPPLPEVFTRDFMLDPVPQGEYPPLQNVGLQAPPAEPFDPKKMDGFIAEISEDHQPNPEKESPDAEAK